MVGERQGNGQKPEARQCGVGVGGEGDLELDRRDLDGGVGL